MQLDYPLIPPHVLAHSDPKYIGKGASKGLARGLLLSLDGREKVGEGMGLGAIAVRMHDQTIFAVKSTDTIVGHSEIIKEFQLNHVCGKAWRGKESERMNKAGERIVQLYMRYPWLQKSILHPRIIATAQKICRISNTFIPVASVARATFSYKLSPGKIEISGEITWQQKPAEKVYLLNELSAEFLDACWNGHTTLPAPSGWQLAIDNEENLALQNKASGFMLDAKAFRCSAQQWQKIYGRESSATLSWAGIIYEITPELSACSPLSFTYCLDLRYR
jgi:hypothetical protein